MDKLHFDRTDLLSCCEERLSWKWGDLSCPGHQAQVQQIIGLTIENERLRPHHPIDLAK